MWGCGVQKLGGPVPQDVATASIGVFVLDDHDVVRDGLRLLLEETVGVTLVGSAATAGEALERIRQLRPDVALIDLRLTEVSGIEVVRHLRVEAPDTRCVIYTSYRGEEPFYQAMLAGAVGYVLKDAGRATLIDTIVRAAAGESLMSREALDELTTNPPASGSLPLFSDFSPQERRIVGAVLLGETNAEIAHEMHLAEKTVRNYVSNILLRLRLRNRTQLAVYAALHLGPEVGRELTNGDGPSGHGGTPHSEPVTPPGDRSPPAPPG